MADAAALCDRFVADLHALEIESAGELLTMEQAEVASGYSREQLQRLAREGKLRATGKGSQWRVARRDLPRKASVVAQRGDASHVPGAKAEQVVRDSVGASNGIPQ